MRNAYPTDYRLAYSSYGRIEYVVYASMANDTDPVVEYEYNYRGTKAHVTVRYYL